MTRSPRTFTALVATVILGLGAGGAGAAAGTSVSLKLKGEYGKRHVRECGKGEDFRLFHPRSRAEIKGDVVPAPAGHFPVKVELRRCSRGHWIRAGELDLTGKKLTGKFKGFFGVRAYAPRSRHGVTYMYVRAVVSGHDSRKVYFAVTR